MASLRMRRLRLLGIGVAAASAAAAAAAPAQTRPDRAGGTVDIQLLGLNDLHGNLEPPEAIDGRPAGGVAFLASWLDRLEADNPGGTIRVHAGDAVGGSPLVSSYFHDEPTIRALDAMRFDIGTVGNHEFDEGGREMMRLIRGGPRRGRRARKGGVITSDPHFPGASFPYVSANVVRRRTGKPFLPPYRVIRRRGIKIGFIGVTTRETPSIVPAGAVRPYRFRDISSTVNQYARVLRRHGVRTIVVLAHAGGERVTAGEAKGEIIDETRQMTDTVDVVVAGHTHTLLNERVGHKLVVEGLRYGTALDDVDLRVSRRTGDVVGSRARVVTTFDDAVQPAGVLARLVEGYTRRVASVANRPIATAGSVLSRFPDDAGESPLGDLLADSQRAAAGSDFAVANLGGIRAGIAEGEVSYGELFGVQPFENRIVRMALRGWQIRRLLEQQFQPRGANMLQVSGLRFRYDATRPAGRRITALTSTAGAPIAAGRRYSLAASGYLAQGGDGFTVLRGGTRRRTLGSDVDALAAHVESLPQPFGAPGDAGDRISRDG